MNIDFLTSQNLRFFEIMLMIVLGAKVGCEGCVCKLGAKVGEKETHKENLLFLCCLFNMKSVSVQLNYYVNHADHQKYQTERRDDCLREMTAGRKVKNQSES